MKKLIMILAAVAAMLPAAAFADQYHGTYGGFQNNMLSFSVGGHRHSMRCAHNRVRFYDEHGAVYNSARLAPGHPITVHYRNSGGHRTVERVIVRQRKSDQHRRNH